MNKKTTKKTATKKTTTKAAAKKTPAKKPPRMSASAARAEGAARTKRALQAKHATDASAEADPEATTRPPAGQGEGRTPPKATGGPNATRAKDGPNPILVGRRDPLPTLCPPKRPSGLDLAAKVLADAGEPLAAKGIAERAIAAGWTTSGKTPHATLYAAIIREISKKGDAARFKKTDRGLFVAASAKGVS